MQLSVRKYYIQFACRYSIKVYHYSFSQGNQHLKTICPICFTRLITFSCQKKKKKSFCPLINGLKSLMCLWVTFRRFCAHHIKQTVHSQLSCVISQFRNCQRCSQGMILHAVQSVIIWFTPVWDVLCRFGASSTDKCWRDPSRVQVNTKL